MLIVEGKKDEKSLNTLDLTNILAEIHKFTETNIAKPFNEFTEKNIAKPLNEFTETNIYAVYNEGINSYKAIQWFICENEVNYPTFNGKRKDKTNFL